MYNKHIHDNYTNDHTTTTTNNNNNKIIIMTTLRRRYSWPWTSEPRKYMYVYI